MFTTRIYKKYKNLSIFYTKRTNNFTQNFTNFTRRNRRPPQDCRTEVRISIWNRCPG